MHVCDHASCTGLFGIIHTRAPTESRCGAQALLSGVYEDASIMFAHAASYAQPLYDTVLHHVRQSVTMMTVNIQHVYAPMVRRAQLEPAVRRVRQGYTQTQSQSQSQSQTQTQQQTQQQTPHDNTGADHTFVIAEWGTRVGDDGENDTCVDTDRRAIHLVAGWANMLVSACVMSVMYDARCNYLCMHMCSMYAAIAYTRCMSDV